MDGDYNAIIGADGKPVGEATADGFASALFVLTEVMSAPGPGRFVVDAGLKASSVPTYLPTSWLRCVAELIRRN